MPSISENYNELVLQRPRRNKSLDGIYYHITTDACLGNSITFEPQIPIESCFSELKIPRICFSPTVSQCFIAINHKIKDVETFYVYSSDIEVYDPIGVEDVEVTGEVWSLRTEHLHKVNIISKNSFSLEDWNIFKTILKASYYNCWKCFGFEKELSVKYLDNLKELFKKYNVEERP